MTALGTPPSLLAVDPGKTSCGVAFFLKHRLVSADFLTADNTFLLGEAVEEWWGAQRLRFALPEKVDQLVTESQQAYAASAANPNDLLPLAYLCGAVQARIRAHQTLMPLPRVWKGSLKKETFTRQILSRLHRDEISVIKEVKCPASKLHNVIDAAGLGLWVLGALRLIPDDGEVVQ